MVSVTEIFSSMVFDDSEMKKRLPEDTYVLLQNTIKNGKHLDMSVATVVANAMKDWALEKGATHFTHWFQPMTGITAEKHESFIAPQKDGKAIMEFSGKELIKGESDASSFPSGGLRATFEARGYTAWDATSYAFIKDSTLYIPTVFCSYNGEALDQKTALLRSMEAINRQTLRILRLFHNDTVKSIKTTVGPEQEYFLIDKSMYDKRKDLIYTGRTLFGARSPKGQELSDHYYGTIKAKVLDFMKELNIELWKLGVFSRTEHNEAAPAQHEMAPIYNTTNIAADHNQITMEMMQKIAKKYDMVCLLHEKPFAGVNGSGKHNNWSIKTDTGLNLFEPGDTPHENAQFLLFLTAVIKAVDEYQDLLRISVASPANDHRLGANEAPPAIVSIFIGEHLESILDAIENEKEYSAEEEAVLRVGVHTLPKFPKDTSDRNRTSPFAFTGNKFEFRMLGSSSSISLCNTVLNTAVAEVLKQFADTLEPFKDDEKGFNIELHDLIKNTYSKHKRIIFNGDGYGEQWVKEAAKRGLSNLETTPDAFNKLLDDKNIKLFEDHKVFSKVELCSRQEIYLDNYIKIITIEALTMIDMVNKDILPAVSKYIAELSCTAKSKRELYEDINIDFELFTVKKLSELQIAAYNTVKTLENAIFEAKTVSDTLKLSMCYKSQILPLMKNLRKSVDSMEEITSSEVWPYPSYGEILFGIK